MSTEPASCPACGILIGPMCATGHISGGFECQAIAFFRPPEQIRKALWSLQRFWPTHRDQCGCCLHLVIDDDNWEREHIEFCRDQAEREGHPDCFQLAELLIETLTDAERAGVFYYFDRWCSGQYTAERAARAVFPELPADVRAKIGERP